MTIQWVAILTRFPGAHGSRVLPQDKQSFEVRDNPKALFQLWTVHNTTGKELKHELRPATISSWFAAFFYWQKWKGNLIILLLFLVNVVSVTRMFMVQTIRLFSSRVFIKSVLCHELSWTQQLCDRCGFFTSSHVLVSRVFHDFLSTRFQITLKETCDPVAYLGSMAQCVCVGKSFGGNSRSIAITSSMYCAF